ncbi:cathepsin O [Eulemur rufifrons]|uniref:cathepsin O n=1 Tax=Eulemur rufifrons TaxID=859984 RepID=UPI0037446658
MYPALRLREDNSPQLLLTVQGYKQKMERPERQTEFPPRVALRLLWSGWEVNPESTRSGARWFQKEEEKHSTKPINTISRNLSSCQFTTVPGTEQRDPKESQSPGRYTPLLCFRPSNPGRGRSRGIERENGRGWRRSWGERMELRWLLWLLCCGGGAGSGATFTATWPRSREREAAAFRESLNRHRYLNSLFHSENSTAIYGINQFSYLFPEEFKAIYLRSKPSRFPRYSAGVQTSVSNVSLPSRFDWRDKHVVTQVRNQQMCGGCWAFSVVGAVESVCAIKGGTLEDLSVQQVIDCSYDNYGCSGGSTLNALNWLNKTQVKLVKDSEYPFKAQNGLCHYFSGSHFGFSIKDYYAYDFSEQEDEMVKALLNFGPLVVIVDAVSWQDYLGGIIQHHCSSREANHAVLITGFDKTGSTPYWIVRNSWGSSWGVDGYAHVKMGSNICGIADSVSAIFV